MEILIQSVLQNAKRFGSSLHIRYLERKGQPVEKSGNGGNSKELELPDKSGGPRKTSCVIIREPYSYLEPVIRSMFEGAQDVSILVDRRSHERREGFTSFGIANRRRQRDRRQAVPMLDILINVET